ncbi:MAG: CxxC motif-containing protein (DUF1111 family) [Myxococcota bacterium]
MLLALFRSVALADASPPECATEPDGAELFARSWVLLDPRSPAGDGLGPVYNDVSCAACHSLGGQGGAGPRSRNV